MSDIELVIKIPEEAYKATCIGSMLPPDVKNVINAIANGTPLPKGHGRLIDASYLLNLLKCEKYESCSWKNCSDCNQEKCIRKHNILEAMVLDKIRDEIMDTGAYEQEVHGKTEFLKGIDYCLSVIDKYKAESEK